MRTKLIGFLIIGSGLLTAQADAMLTHSETVKIITSDGGTNLWIETDDNDSVLTFIDPGQHWFSMGIDKSDAGTFKIREGGDLTSSRGISIKTNGQVGIGTASPSTLFNVSAGVSGDAVLLIEADTESGGSELDNPRIEFLQDNSAVGAMVGFREEVNSALNLFRISAYGSSSPVYDALTISPWTQYVSVGARLGIGTSNPVDKLDVADSFYSRTGYIVIRPQNSTNEGGQIVLAGSASNPSWNLDSYNDRFRIFNSAERFSITGSGNVGIGTSTPGNKLEVNGTIRAREVIVESTGWPDYVFGDGYALDSLSSIESHIEEHGHLPGVPSGEDVSQGVRLGVMQQIMMEKIEELTLHLIRQEKEIEELRLSNKSLREAIHIQ